MRTLYRSPVVVLYHLQPDGQAQLPARPPPAYVSARSSKRKKPPKPRASDAPPPRPIPPGALVLIGLLRPDGRLSRFPRPWECDPWAIWNCLGLGHWTEFAWTALIAELIRRSGWVSPA